MSEICVVNLTSEEYDEQYGDMMSPKFIQHDVFVITPLEFVSTADKFDKIADAWVIMINPPLIFWNILTILNAESIFVMLTLIVVVGIITTHLFVVCKNLLFTNKKKKKMRYDLAHAKSKGLLIFKDNQ